MFDTEGSAIRLLSERFPEDTRVQELYQAYIDDAAMDAKYMTTVNIYAENIRVNNPDMDLSTVQKQAEDLAIMQVTGTSNVRDAKKAYRETAYNNGVALETALRFETKNDSSWADQTGAMFNLQSNRAQAAAESFF